MSKCRFSQRIIATTSVSRQQSLQDTLLFEDNTKSVGLSGCWSNSWIRFVWSFCCPTGIFLQWINEDFGQPASRGKLQSNAQSFEESHRRRRKKQIDVEVAIPLDGHRHRSTRADFQSNIFIIDSMNICEIFHVFTKKNHKASKDGSLICFGKPNSNLVLRFFCRSFRSEFLMWNIFCGASLQTKMIVVSCKMLCIK